MIVVSNATPLIALTAIGSLDLLANLFVEVHLPDAVYEEVVVAGAGKAGRTRLLTPRGSCGKE